MCRDSIAHPWEQHHSARRIGAWHLRAASWAEKRPPPKEQPEVSGGKAQEGLAAARRHRATTEVNLRLAMQQTTPYAFAGQQTCSFVNFTERKRTQEDTRGPAPLSSFARLGGQDCATTNFSRQKVLALQLSRKKRFFCAVVESGFHLTGLIRRGGRMEP